MGIRLFRHNQTAYDAAISMMEEKGKAAVIHPTGTGKSFLGFKLAQEHPGKRVCWLSPSEYIFKTQAENLKRSFPSGQEGGFDNIRFISYSKLMADEGCIGELKPDYIVLDEFHRCGAARWGASVRRLLAAYPDARALGLSATNIRYLDGQRDMAQEIFDGNIASEMTLGEAVAGGILPSPKYVLALYSYEKELKALERRVRALPGEGPAGHQELLERFRRTLEQAEGLDRVFERHMRKRNGKYIVFCADREHMDEMKGHVGEWFRLVDEEPHCYTAFYSSSGTGREFAAFKADDSAHLKLLFCINMLNEGVHVEDVDGVILLRPTVSPIVYLQQIGRALSAGVSSEPVIFDLVNNFDSLCCIDYLEQELDEAFSLMPRARGDGEKWNGRFLIVDEVGDCRRLFKQLKCSLGSTWDAYYRAAGDYYEEKGNLRVPKGYVTPQGLTLGSWIRTQRKVYAGKAPGALSEERIRKLEALGMVWDVRNSGWEEGCRELLSYCERYGNADVKARYVAESGFPLGKWVSNLRAAVRNKGIGQALTEEQREKLEALGMIWDKNGEKWEAYLRAAQEYRKRYGDLRVPVKYVTEDGLLLGRWLHAVRHGMSGERRRSETLTQEQIKRLEELGMEWEKSGDALWDRKYELAKAYYEEHGNLDIPVAYSVEGVKLGRWLSNMRVKRRNPGTSGMRLDGERIRRLDRIGMDWK